MSGLMVVGTLTLLLSVFATAISGGIFSAQYRHRRRTTRWMHLPTVPMSRGMWLAVGVLALSEGGIVLSIVLLIVGAEHR